MVPQGGTPARYLSLSDSLGRHNLKLSLWSTPGPHALRFRKLSLYSLIYEGGDGAKCGAKFADTCCITVDKASAAQLQKEYCPQIPLFMFTGTDLPVKTHTGRERANALECLKRS